MSQRALVTASLEFESIKSEIEVRAKNTGRKIRLEVFCMRHGFIRGLSNIVPAD
jgi:hypothetical protein